MSSIIQRRKGLIIAIGIGVGAFLLFLPSLPWVRPEITSNAEVIKINDDSCEVISELDVIHGVSNCQGYKVGDKVVIKYREGTYVADIVSTP